MILNTNTPMEKNMYRSVEARTRVLMVEEPHSCQLSYKAGASWNETAAEKRNVGIMAPDRMRCGVAKFTQKSTHSGVTIHFQTWVPYLTLLPTPSPTRENFMMQDFPTTLYIISVRPFNFFPEGGYILMFIVMCSSDLDSSQIQ